MTKGRPNPPERALRRDAALNRDRLVQAARVVFATYGVDVALEEVAKQAGVGTATLHRRITRAELIEAVLLERARDYLRIAEDALQAQTGWDGFVGYLRQLCEIQVSDRSAADVLTLRLPDCPAVTQIRDQIYYAQLELILRAQREGSLREDLVPEDVIMVLLANGGIVTATADGAPEAWRRFFAMIVASLRAGIAEALPAAPRPEDLLAALHPPRPGRRTSDLAPR